MDSQEYDYIIVGAGSAGCVLARRLSNDEDVRVLLLEAGGMDRNFWLKLPVGYFRTIYDDRFSRVFETEPSDGDGQRGIAWPRGRILGGSSSINGLVYIRGQAEGFDDWQKMGADGWSYRELLPHFRDIETYSAGEDTYHGRDGPLSVSDLRNENRACQAWLEAAQQLGLPFNDDFNGRTSLGVGSYQLSLNGRWRSSAAAAFLHPVLGRGNLTLSINALVSRVIVERGRATGVEWTDNGTVQRAVATREVILSAGTIQTPQIMQLSGIGPPALLREHGIAVAAESPEVGENLQDHYQARLILRLSQPLSLNDAVRNPLKLAQMGLEWLASARGPLTVGAGQVGGGACTRHAEGDRPDIQFNVMPLSVDKPGTPLHRFSGFTTSVWQCHPQSRGSVHIQSADPARQPRIAPNYFSAAIDRDVMIEGVKLARAIHEQPALRGLWESEVVPGPDTQSDEQIFDYIRNEGGTVFHPVGTCRMGSDERAVVDPQLRVRGVDGLRVVDASIMPLITSANSNAASLMIGEKGASLIRGNRSG